MAAMLPGRREQTNSPDRVKVAVIKGQQVFVVLFDPLNRMCLAFREVPDVALSKLLDLILAILVDR